MTGAIDKQLYGYIERMNRAQKKSLLGFMQTIFSGSEDGAITIEEYNRELDEADAAMDRGEFYTHEEATNYFKKLLSAK